MSDREKKEGEQEGDGQVRQGLGGPPGKTLGERSPGTRKPGKVTSESEP